MRVVREDVEHGTGNDRAGGSGAWLVGRWRSDCNVMGSVTVCDWILGGKSRLEEIAEHFGLGFLHLVSGAAMLAIFRKFLVSGGILYEVVQQYLGGICG